MKKEEIFLNDIRGIINTARAQAIRSVDFCRVQMYWHMGKRMYYELESVNNGWTARETERQINSQLYERLLLSNDKEAVLAVARKERIPQSPLEIIKDPMFLEFLGLERKTAYYEKEDEI